jgi:putative transposase
LKKQYQIGREKAVQAFREQAQQTKENIQTVLPLQEVVGLLEQGLGQLIRAVGQELMKSVMEAEVRQRVGEPHQANRQREYYRWGQEQGYCVVDGQKVPLPRPRIRRKCGTEAPLGSYELFQRGSLIGEAVWTKVMHGLSMRSYGEVIQQFVKAYGVEKSTISEHFIRASGERLQRLLERRLDTYAIAAVIVDGTIFKQQNLVAAIGIAVDGRKIVLGFRQGATENATVVGELLSDLADRGLELSVPRLWVIDGSKGLRAAIRKKAGEAAVIQRCQVHKIRNVTEHLSEDYQSAIRYKMRAAYRMMDYADAKRALEKLHHELMHLNPSAAKSLEEGLEDTLAVHRLRVPHLLRRTLASTNVIESTFSLVDKICSRVKNWKEGDHRLRWVGSALLYAESRWYRVKGHAQIPLLCKELELVVLRRFSASPFAGAA